MRCVRCRTANYCAAHAEIRLVHRDALHPSLWINEHIHHYYRPHRMPPALCIKSAFKWTNETVNIWSHLLGFLYFSYTLVQVNYVLLPAMNATSLDHLVTSSAIFGAMMCMLLSACYHTFGCHSRRARHKWLKWDIIGISTGLLSMYLMGIYTSFYCFEEWLQNYIYVLIALTVVSVSVPMQRDSLQKAIIGGRVAWLHIIYCCLALFGLLPTMHWVELHGGLSSPHVMEWLPNIGVVYALTLIAFFFFVSMFPERWRPGQFDRLGCSHQWWHLFILAAIACWMSAGLRRLQRIRTDMNFCLDLRFAGKLNTAPLIIFMFIYILRSKMIRNLSKRFKKACDEHHRSNAEIQARFLNNKKLWDCRSSN